MKKEGWAESCDGRIRKKERISSWKLDGRKGKNRCGVDLCFLVLTLVQNVSLVHQTLLRSIRLLLSCDAAEKCQLNRGQATASIVRHFCSSPFPSKRCKHEGKTLQPPKGTVNQGKLEYCLYSAPLSRHLSCCRIRALQGTAAVAAAAASASADSTEQTQPPLDLGYF